MITTIIDKEKTMNRKTFILAVVLIGMLIINACGPVPTPILTPVPPADTDIPPTPTNIPSPTPRPEKNISYQKPVRVSASWIVDPPEKAVDGDLYNWWGAGGPPPVWIEVDLEGIYSISKIRVINQGPTGLTAYQILGRSPGGKNQLLHVFDEIKKENQILTFSPETPWQDISTIRVEIHDGIGWAGLREVQVFSRDDPKPLPVYEYASIPRFSTQVELADLQEIAPENAYLMEQLAMLGRGPINDLVWSQDGTLLAAPSPLGIWLYDTTAVGQPPRLLEGHTRDVLAVTFSPNRELLLSSSQDGTVKEWYLATGELKRTIELWNDFSHEIGNADRTVEVWSIAFSPDGKLLAAGRLDGTVRLWNLATRKSRDLPKVHVKQVTNLEFSPDGALLASSSSDGTIYVWNVSTGTQRASSANQGNVQTLAFSPDGKTLAYSADAKAARLWDIDSGQENVDLTEHPGALTVTYKPDGLALLTSSFDGNLRSWNAETGSTQIFRERAGWIMTMAYSPDGERLATYAWDGSLRLWDTATASHQGNLAVHTSPVTSIAFGPDGNLLASGSEDGAVRLWDVEKNNLLNTMFGHNGRVFGVAFSPNGVLIASAGLDRTVRLWNATTGDQVGVLSGHKQFVRCVAFSPDGTLVASGSTDKTIRLWDASTLEERAVLTGHAGEVESVAFSADGRWLVSASADKTVRIWNVEKKSEAGILQGHLSFVLGAAFSPDGSVVASAGADHWLKAWSLGETLGVVIGKDQFTPIGHPGWVLSVAFSPNGKIIASSNLSTTSFYVTPGEIHLYSTETGFPYMLLRGHTKRVTSIAFSSDGRLLASGSADGSVRLWGIREEIVQDAPPEGWATSTATQTSAPTASPMPISDDPFIGEWTTYDSHDGSNMTLSVSREGEQYIITQVDEKASACGKDSSGQPIYAITIQFTGKVQGRELSAAMTSATCMSNPPNDLSLNLSNVFTYNSAADTLVDSLANYVWERR